MAINYRKLGLSIYQGGDWKKENGKKLTQTRKKRKYEYGRFPILTKIGKEEVRYIIRTKGGSIKVKLKEALYANVLDKETNTIKKVKILDVLKNPADRNLDRMKVITKNSIIKTEIGDAIVTSRPGQDGTINAVLIKAQ
ncbi:MAG: 30S ribosomal protein S8e [Nanoarchaeales archaeon]